MNREIRRKINEFANDILVEIFDGNLGIPVDPQKAVEIIGGYLKADSLGPGIDGFIRRTNNDGFEITIRNDLSENRRRFTIAHELGHLFLHMDYLNKEKWQSQESFTDSPYYRGNGDYSETELQAHEFAAAFLMPKDLFIDISVENTDESGLCSIDEVAEYFKVSRDAAINRGKWLGIFKW